MHGVAMLHVIYFIATTGAPSEFELVLHLVVVATHQNTQISYTPLGTGHG